MTLKEAKALRDEIRETGIYCTVPLGQKPNQYFARIFASWDGGAAKPYDFHKPSEWTAYQKWAERERVKRRMPPPRSPIEMMIDKACGLI